MLKSMMLGTQCLLHEQQHGFRRDRGAALAALADENTIGRDVVAGAMHRYNIVATDLAPWEA